MIKIENETFLKPIKIQPYNLGKLNIGYYVVAQ